MITPEQRAEMRRLAERWKHSGGDYLTWLSMMKPDILLALLDEIDRLEVEKDLLGEALAQEYSPAIADALRERLAQEWQSADVLPPQSPAAPDHP